MKKLNTLGSLLMMGAFAFAGYSSAQAADYVEVKLDNVYEIADGSSLQVYFTPSANGVLSITQWGSSDPFLFTVPTDNYEDYGNMAQNTGYSGTDPYTFTYEVEAGTTYYYYGVHNNSAYLELSKVEFSFEAGEGGEGGEGGDTPTGPSGYEPLELDKNYSVTGVGSVKLYYTATQNGILSVVQTGSYDSHFYSVEPVYDSEFDYGLNTPMPPSSELAPEATSPYTLEFGVVAGVTYYYVAKTNNYDDLSAVSFSFDGNQTSEEIQLNTPYVVSSSSPVMSFTPEESGILSVQWSSLNPRNSAYTTAIVQGGQQFFLYYDYACSESQTVPLLDFGDGDGRGYEVTFNVEAGVTYYLHLGGADALQFEFSLQSGDTMQASITSIEPVPGKSYDIVNFRYYWNMQFAPNDATVERITLSYVPASDPSTVEVIEIPLPEMGYGAFRVPADALVSRLEKNEIADNTEFTFTLYGLKAGGKYVTHNLMSQGSDYVTIGENGLVTVSFLCGTPIELLNAEFPNPFLASWEAGDPNGFATLIFDSEVYVVNGVEVIAGHHYYGSEGGGENVYSQALPQQNISWEGNKVTIDFTNIRWGMPSGTTEVTIFVYGPVGANGLPANYDGVPAYTHYARFTTDGAAEIDEPIISYIDPVDGAEVEGLFNEETIRIALLETVMSSTVNVDAVLTDSEGTVIATFDDFFQNVSGQWLYEIEGTEYIFYEGETYYLTVTAYNEDGNKIGSQVVTWYGTTTPSGDTTGIGAIDAENGAAVYYNLQGAKVANPERGIFIKVVDGKAVKVVK